MREEVVAAVGSVEHDVLARAAGLEARAADRARVRCDDRRPCRGHDVLTLVDVAGAPGAEARVRAAEVKRAGDREDAGPGRRRRGIGHQRGRTIGTVGKRGRGRSLSRLRPVHDDPHPARVRAAAPQRPPARILDVQAQDVAPGLQLQRAREPSRSCVRPVGSQPERLARHRPAARQAHEHDPRMHPRDPALADA